MTASPHAAKPERCFDAAPGLRGMGTPERPKAPVTRMQAKALQGRLEHKSRAEIAAELKISPAAVKQRLARAYKRLAAEQRARFFAAACRGTRLKVRPIRLSFVDNV